MTVDEIAAQQRKDGTFRSKFMQLQSELRRFGELGPDNGDWEAISLSFLKTLEDSRIKSEHIVRDLEKKIIYAKAEAIAASRISDQWWQHIQTIRVAAEKAISRQERTGTKDIVTSEQLYASGEICMCGCRDEEDAAECDCACHQGLPCVIDACVHCAPFKEKTEGSPAPEQVEVILNNEAPKNGY